MRTQLANQGYPLSCTGLGCAAYSAAKISSEGQKQSVNTGRLASHYVTYGTALRSAAETFHVPVSILVAVMDRESLGQNIIGDGGHGRGLMQIDDRSHRSFLNKNAQGLDPWTNIHFAAQLLHENHSIFGRWDFALAAYNAGPEQVRQALIEKRAPDTITAHGNYSSDVLMRAKAFEELIASQ